MLDVLCLGRESSLGWLTHVNRHVNEADKHAPDNDVVHVRRNYTLMAGKDEMANQSRICAALAFRPQEVAAKLTHRTGLSTSV